MGGEGLTHLYIWGQPPTHIKKENGHNKIVVRFLAKRIESAHDWLGGVPGQKTPHHFPAGDKVPAPIKDPPYVPPAVLPKTDTQRIKELSRC